MYELRYIILLILFTLPQQIWTLEPFNPYQQNGTCTSSMSICLFELRATAAMTMFYRNLFRVTATDNGTLENYQNPNQTFSMADILTADGYPKLVRSIFFYVVRHPKYILFRFMSLTILYQVPFCKFIRIKQCAYVSIMTFRQNRLVFIFMALSNWVHQKVTVSDE